MWRYTTVGLLTLHSLVLNAWAHPTFKRHASLARQLKSLQALPLKSERSIEQTSDVEEIHQLNKRVCEEYSAVVAFGASFTDNAHARDSMYSSSIKPAPYFQGRWSNGLVFNEYASQTLGAKLYNYAYGGAQVNDILTGGTVPSTRAQIDQYMTDIQSNTIDRGNKSVLHIWWIGINPLKTIIQDAISSGAANGNPSATQDAEHRVDQQIWEVTDQVVTIRNNPNVTKSRTNILLLPIPALEVVPDVSEFAVANSGGNQKLHDSTLQLIKTLSDRYNNGLMDWSNKEAKQNNNTSGWVRTYDVPSLWRDLYSDPGTRGFTQTSTPCYNSGDGSICSNPDQYIQWDSLHPTTRIHALVGSACAQIATQCT